MPPLMNTGLSPAASDLGMGLGDMLQDQVAGETDEQRKRRMREQQQAGLMPAGTASSPASLALFGGMGGLSKP